MPGTKSIRITNPTEGGGRGLWHARYSAPLPEADYTFSVYLKSDVDMRVMLSVFGKKHELTIEREWQRYSFTMKGGGTNIHLKMQSKGNLWVNAPQLEKGTRPTSFALPSLGANKIVMAGIPQDILFPLDWRILPKQLRCVRIVTAESHGGSKSVKMSGTGPKYISNGDTLVKIAKEKDYLFSCWIKTESVNGVLATPADTEKAVKGKGIFVTLVAFNKKRGWIKELSLDQRIATSGTHDWRKFELVIPSARLPPETEYLGFWCYAPFNDAEGIVEWDDFSLVDVKEPQTNLVANPGFELCDGLKTKAEGKPLIVLLNRSFYTDEETAYLIVKNSEKDNQGEVEVRLVADGNIVLRKTAALTPFKARIPLDIDSLSPGDYTLEVKVVADIGGKIERRLLLKKLMKSANEVKIDREHCMLMVDGKPFIPFGLGVETEVKQSVWKDIAAHGFNTACYHRRNFTAVELDHVWKEGLRVECWMVEDWKKSLADLKSYYLRQVSGLKNHPAVLAWYQMDEPSFVSWEHAGKKESDLAVLQQTIKEVDPYHPSFLNYCASWRIGYGDYGGLAGTEILSRDEYPLDYSAWRRDADVAEALTSWAFQISQMRFDGERSGKPVRQWIQMSQVMGDSPCFLREVTPAEEKCMTYLALIYGTRVLTYYVHKPMSIALWDSFIPLSKEIESLTPILTGDDLSGEAIGVDNPNIHFLLKIYKGKKYLICVNLSEAPVAVTFKLNRDFFGSEGKVNMLFGRKRLDYLDYTIKDDFGGLEAKVYQMRDVNPRREAP
ncbi:MAG: hypothetical protein PHV34_22235 [Verrucomicrobiae bacterium]|nr:hypothetical protein [Verrucomicrobiae bacterium]